MNNWRKRRNYRKQENSDGTFTYIIMVDDAEVEVSKEVYTAYAASERKLEYIERDLKRDRVLQDSITGKIIKDANGLPIMLPEREVSLDKLVSDDWDYPSSELLPEEMFIKQQEIDALYNCLDLLSSSERELITALFFDGLTEREYANKLNITQKAVNKRKHKILEKLQKLFLKNGTQN